MALKIIVNCLEPGVSVAHLWWLYGAHIWWLFGWGKSWEITSCWWPTFWQPGRSNHCQSQGSAMTLTLTMTSAEVITMSVTKSSSFQDSSPWRSCLSRQTTLKTLYKMYFDLHLNEEICYHRVIKTISQQYLSLHSNATATRALQE